MLNAGIDKAVVQKLLGHTDPKMTDRYAEFSQSSLKIALDNVIKLPDRGHTVDTKKTDSVTC
jgi:site-specific recombinase XerD